MRRRNVAVVVGIVGIIAIFFFLPLIPVKVEDTPCTLCPGGLFIEEQGYSSMGLYFFGYGGIYLSSLPNFPDTYVGYCVVYGTSSSTSNSCGWGIALLWGYAS